MIKKYVLFGLLGLTVTTVCGAKTKPVLALKHWVTQNGAQVYFVAAPELPMVDIQVAFVAGSARDSDKLGVARLTNAMLNQGAGKLNADQLARAFEDVGAIYGSNSARDMAIVTLRSLTQSELLQPALNTFATVLAEATFPKQAFGRERSLQFMVIKSNQQSPARIASNAFYRAAFNHHPYGHPVLGNQQTVSALTTNDLKQFYKQFYVAHNATIAIVGALSLQQAHAVAEQITVKLVAGQHAAPLPPVEALAKSVNEAIDYPVSQTNIRIGQASINRKMADYFPLLVGNYSLGGGAFVSRLYQEVREKRGLSYSVYSAFIPMADKGPFIVSLGTKNQQADQALSVVRSTLNQFIDQGPTEQELNAAKQYMVGNFPLRLASNKAIAATVLNMGFYQLPLTYLDDYKTNVNAVSFEQVRDAFKRHLQPNKMVTIRVGGKTKTKS